jgi:tetratricopeptide (TPR) repeat protein
MPAGKVIKQDFESLTVILSVAMVLAIASLATNLINTLDMNPGQPVATQVSGSQVAGYSMPGHFHGHVPPGGEIDHSKGPHQLNHADGPADAFRQAFNEPQSDRERKIAERFQEAVALLHAKRYGYAITALDSVLQMAPNMPEAYVNMGYAFIGTKEYGPARNAFEKAIDIKVDQVNAYYGLAMAFEGLKDYEGALGAMNTYIHLSKPDDPFLTRAKAAVWEWQAELGRIKGVEVAPEGVKGDTIDAPFKWSQKHKTP